MAPYRESDFKALVPTSQSLSSTAAVQLALSQGPRALTSRAQYAPLLAWHAFGRPGMTNGNIARGFAVLFAVGVIAAVGNALWWGGAVGAVLSLLMYLRAVDMDRGTVVSRFSLQLVVKRVAELEAALGTHGLMDWLGAEMPIMQAETIRSISVAAQDEINRFCSALSLDYTWINDKTLRIHIPRTEFNGTNHANLDRFREVYRYLTLLLQDAGISFLLGDGGSTAAG